MHIVLDFETRSRYPIKAGASRYSLDKSTDVLCLAYQIDGSPVKLWKPGDEDPHDLFDAIANGAPVWAHNVTFEIAIWQNVMVDRYFWPKIPPRQWRCTMAECMAVGLPSSLENVGLALDIESDSLKDKAGHRVMLKLSKPRKPTKKNKKEWHDKPEDFGKLYEYCKQDVVAEAAIHKRVPRLNNRELSVFHYDKVVNGRGVKIDRALAESAVYLWDEHTTRLNTELDRLTEGRVSKGSEVAKLIAELARYDIYTGELKKATVDELLSGDIDPKARRILEIRKELGLSSVSKYKAMLLSIESDDRIRGCLQYHGAQTGRFAGRLIQPQNFARGMISSEREIEFMVEMVKKRDYDLIGLVSPLPVGQLLSSLLRSAIIADKGKKLIVADFAAIEARGLAWASGEQWLLQAFRDKTDVYKHMASDIYKVPYSEVTKDQRFYGKTTILGAGYSMGATKFQTFLDTLGVSTTFDFCDKVIKAYRQKNKKIVASWYDTERAAVKAVETGASQHIGPFAYYMECDWLKCRLPAGRSIAYYKPTLVDGKFGKQIRYTGTNISGKPVSTSTYSGKLVENWCQALCRDLLVDAMIRLEKANYTVTLSVHDEIIAEVPEDFGSVEEMEAIMCEVPAWAKGFPISAEGFEARRYRK